MIYQKIDNKSRKESKTGTSKRKSATSIGSRSEKGVQDLEYRHKGKGESVLECSIKDYLSLTSLPEQSICLPNSKSKAGLHK